MVPGMGFEPIRTFVLRFLRPLRLPLRHPGLGELGPSQRIADYRQRCWVRWVESDGISVDKAASSRPITL